MFDALEQGRLASIARLEQNMELLKRDLTIRLGGMMVTGILIVAALVKLL